MPTNKGDHLYANVANKAGHRDNSQTNASEVSSWKGSFPLLDFLS